MGLLDRFRTRKQPARTAPRLRPVQLRSFGGAETTRLTADWLTHPETADALVLRHQRVLVARSREQARNNDYARAFIRMVRQNVVGPSGIILQAQCLLPDGQMDAAANEAIEAAFSEWSRRENCDVAGEKSLRAIEAQAMESCVTDGEFMIRKIWGRDAGKFGFALQVLDPQRVDVAHNDDAPIGRPRGHFIRAGIERNAYGRAVAYYFSADRDWQVYNYSSSQGDYLRVPADEVIHGFLPEMVGQKRGLPWMATGLYRLKNLGGFEEAALVNARVGASKMGLFRWRDGMGPRMDEDEQANFQLDIEPGTFHVLPEGAELQEWAPQFPSNDYAPFSKAALRGIAAGFGVLYNNLANDLEGVNFSSIRQGTLDEREHWRELQAWLTESLMQPIYDAWLRVALLRGHVVVNGTPATADNLARYSRVLWQPRRWAWIDPRADIEAAISAKNQFLMSPGQIIRDQGRDPSDVWREIASDIAEMRGAGIPDEFIRSAVLGNNLQATVQAEIAGADGQNEGKNDDAT